MEGQVGQTLRAFVGYRGVLCYNKSKRKHDGLLPDLKQIVVTGFAFNCNGVVAKLRIEIRREANCDKPGASHLCVTAMRREG